ncbi:hypothetical protein A9Q86_13835 [Flavobacteriales bacterium 33_180_T64]|mgnify:CR=1 FL=1|nr:hypothetical protein A9Q86_13835 [Flavobacteriales bacterium 33_180_T64]
MGLNKDTYDRIMSYLNGDMTSTQKDDFERDCKNDIELNETVNIMKNMTIIYGSEDWYALKNGSDKIKETSLLFNNDDVKQFSNKVRASQERYKSKTLNKTSKVLRYVASIAAIGLLAFFLNYYFNINNTTEDLFSTYYTTQDLPSFTVQNSDINTTAKAELLFKEEKFHEALELFNSINENSSMTNPNIILYSAMCNLELEKYDIALNYLEELEHSNTIDFHKSYWFKSLLYLKQNQNDKAILTLKILSKNKNYFNHDKAIELLKELD